MRLKPLRLRQSSLLAFRQGASNPDDRLAVVASLN